MRVILIYLFLIVFSAPLFAGLSITKIAKLPKVMHETSGLALYQKKYLLTHNDSGNKPKLFVLNLNGALIKVITIINAKNVDWEDMTMDNKGNIYMG